MSLASANPDVVSGLVGAGMSYMGMASQRKQFNKMYDLFAPGMKTKNALLEWLRPQIGKGDRTLAAETKIGNEAILQAGARNVRRAKMLWGEKRSTGFAARELMKTREAQARNSILGARAQSDSKMSKVNAIAGLTGESGGYMAQALAMKAQAAQGFWQDLAGFMGDWSGQQQWNKTNSNSNSNKGNSGNYVGDVNSTFG
jgi:hypothetical protein